MPSLTASTAVSATPARSPPQKTPGSLPVKREVIQYAHNDRGEGGGGGEGLMIEDYSEMMEVILNLEF